MQSAGDKNLKSPDLTPRAFSDASAAFSRNDWSDAEAALSYIPVNPDSKQDPSLAEAMDPNKDGLLTCDEYGKGKGTLPDKSFSEIEFSQLRQMARMSVEDPDGARQILGISNIMVPGTTAAEREAEKSAAHDVAWMLIDRAAKQDYEGARQSLGMAGLIFQQFGYADEAAACERQVVKRAEAAGRKEDVALLQGLAAMREGKVEVVRQRLGEIPEGIAGRETLAEYVQRHDGLERMAPAFMAARSMAEIKLSRMHERNLFGHEDLKARGQQLARFFNAWEQRLSSGAFDSTEAILSDIWQQDPESRRSMTMLSGMRPDSQVEQFALAAEHYGDACGKVYHAHEFVLADLVRIESDVGIGTFGDRLDLLKSEGDSEFDNTLVAQEFASLANIYRDVPKFKAYAAEIGKRAEIADDIVKDFILPAAAGEYLGAVALGRVSPWLARFVSRLPLGNAGKAILERLGGEAVQISASSGVFTGINAASAFLDAPRGEHLRGSFLKEWGSLAVCMTFAHLLHVPLGRVRQHMGKVKFLADPKSPPVIVNHLKLPALSPYGKVAYGLIDNAAQTTGFYTGAKVSHRIGLRETPSTLFQEWKNLLLFRVGGKAADKMSGGHLSRTAAEAKGRPYMEASRRIALRLSKETGNNPDALSEAIYLSYVQGDVGGYELIGVSDALAGKGKKAGSIDTVLKANELLASAGITTKDNRVPLFNGIKLQLVTPEARDVYLEELRQQRARNAEVAAPVPAFAMAGEAGPGSGPRHVIDAAAGGLRPTAVAERGETKTEKTEAELPGEIPAEVKEEVRRLVEQQLSKHGESVDVAMALIKLGDLRGLALLEKLQGDARDEVRQDVAWAFGKIGNERAMLHLESMKGDDNSSVRWVVAKAFGEIGGERAMLHLESMIRDDRWDVRWMVAKGFGQIGNERAMLHLESMMGDANNFVRSAVAEAFGRIGGERAMPHLESMMGDDDQPVRSAVARAFGKIGNERAMHDLESMMGDDEGAVRSAVAQAFGQIGGERAMHDLESMMGDDNNFVRWVVAKAFGKIGGERAMHDLESMKGDVNEHVRCAVAEAFGKIGGEHAMRNLEDMAAHGTDVLKGLAFFIDHFKDPQAKSQPHPAGRLAGIIRKVTAELDRVREGQNRGFQNRGVDRGRRPDTSGDDFRDMREVQPGQPLYGRPVWHNGEVHEVVYNQKQGRNTHIIVNPEVYEEAGGEQLGVVTGTLAEIALRRGGPVGLMIGDGKNGKGVAMTTSRGSLEHIVMRTMDAGGGRAMSALELLDQDIVRGKLPRGSRVFLVSNFLNEGDLEGVGRVLTNYRAMGIEVVPIQVGNHMTVPEKVVDVGGRRFKVDLSYQKLRLLMPTRMREMEAADFLVRNGGFSVKAGKDATSESIAQRVIEGTGSNSNMPKAKRMPIEGVEFRFEGEDVLKIGETIPPREVMTVLEQVVEHPDPYSLKVLYKAAQVYGYGVILDWFAGEMSKGGIIRAMNGVVIRGIVPRAIVALESIIATGLARRAHEQHLTMPDIDAWGCQDGAFIKLSNRLLSQKSAPQDVDKTRGGAGVSDYSARISQRIGESDRLDPTTTGAMIRKGEAAFPVWMKLDQLLEGDANYLLDGVYGAYDPAHGSYTVVPGITVESLAGDGQGQMVRGRVVGDANVARMPIPLGARVVSERDGKVQFELADSSPPSKFTDMKLAELRGRGKELYGDRYATLTETVPLDSMPKDVQALIKGLEGANVGDAIQRIQSFVLQNIKYRQYEGAAEQAILEGIQRRAAAGELKGGEYLRFILAVRGGVCAELAEVTMSLLRLSGIPAAKAHAYVADGKKVTTETHAVAMAVFPRGNGKWSAMPVETAESFMPPDFATLLRQMAWQLPASEMNDAVSEEKPTPAADGKTSAAEEGATPSQATAELLAAGSEPSWMARWERADDAGRREMSKMLEYYHMALAYRGHKFGTADVVDLMLTPDQYERFRPIDPRPPTYWLPLIREQAPTPADLERFQKILQENGK
ncbi:MAG: HEAT repeat domain-containing protein [bacterium]